MQVRREQSVWHLLRCLTNVSPQPPSPDTPNPQASGEAQVVIILWFPFCIWGKPGEVTRPRAQTRAALALSLLGQCSFLAPVAAAMETTLTFPAVPHPPPSEQAQPFPVMLPSAPCGPSDVWLML